MFKSTIGSLFKRWKLNIETNKPENFHRAIMYFIKRTLYADMILSTCGNNCSLTLSVTLVSWSQCVNLVFARTHIYLLWMHQVISYICMCCLLFTIIYVPDARLLFIEYDLKKRSFNTCGWNMVDTSLKISQYMVHCYVYFCKYLIH